MELSGRGHAHDRGCREATGVEKWRRGAAAESHHPHGRKKARPIGLAASSAGGGARTHTRKAQDPKSCLSTNFNTPACVDAKLANSALISYICTAMTEKKQIRARMRALETEHAGSVQDAAEAEELFARIEGMPEFEAARTVLAYSSIPGEIPTGAFLHRWYGKKRLVLPRVCGDILELCEYHPEWLQSGYRGILEPAPEATSVDADEIGFALIPGVAFSRQEGPDGKMHVYRMGHGKGFYDRLLPQLHCPEIAMGYSWRWVDYLPLDPWDAWLEPGSTCESFSPRK